MAGKVKVLEVNVDDQGNGGVFSLIKSVIENKPDDLQIDIAALEPFEKKENIRHLKNLGTRIFFAGYKGNKLKKQFVIYKKMCDIVKKGNYDVVHIHADVANKLFVSGMAAKKYGVSKIILHSHATGTDGDNRKLKEKVHKICTGALKTLGAEYAACSYAAAKWMFPGISKSKIIIIKNGIDLKKFSYDPVIREKVRKELRIEKEDYLIGHVGRFMYQKNHKYVIKVFDRFLTKWNKVDHSGKAKLLLVGEGELLKDVRKDVDRKGLSDSVIFYGLSDKVNELMQGMDVFILPSHFEGLPIVGIEAQACGLPVIFSDRITREARFTEDVKYIPITASAVEKWADSLIALNNFGRRDGSARLKKLRLDVTDTKDQLVDLYSK